MRCQVCASPVLPGPVFREPRAARARATPTSALGVGARCKGGPAYRGAEGTSSASLFSWDSRRRVKSEEEKNRKDNGTPEMNSTPQLSDR